MSYKKQKPRDDTRTRLQRDETRYKRLKAEIEKSLWHESPGLGSFISDAVSTVSDAVQGGISSAANAVGSAVSSVGSAIYSGVSNAVDTVGGAVSSVGSTIHSGVSNVADTVGGMLSSAAQGISSPAQVVESWVDDNSSDIVDTGKGVLDDVIDWVGDRADDIYDNFKGGLTDAKKGVTDLFKNAWDTVDNIKIEGGSFFDNALSSLGDMPTLFTKLFETLTGALIINEETYVDDQLRLARLNQQVIQRLTEPEKEGE